MKCRAPSPRKLELADAAQLQPLHRSQPRLLQHRASGLDLHRFNWLSGDHKLGAIQGGWNHLVGVQDSALAEDSPLLHWTLGGPWFREQRTMGGPLAAEWFAARDDAFKLYE